MTIAVIKYNAGNIHSVRLALQRMGIEPLVTSDPDQIQNADKVIFPGVGEARSAMDFLSKHDLVQTIIDLKQPVLGICLGLQLLCRHSEENDTRCLSVFPAEVKKFPPQDKVPHMGWNTINVLKGDLFKNINDGAYVYFVHSYYVELADMVTAKTEYILPFSAAMQKNNFFAVQFHPEKSGKTGEAILNNFIKL